VPLAISSPVFFVYKLGEMVKAEYLGLTDEGYQDLEIIAGALQV